MKKYLLIIMIIISSCTADNERGLVSTSLTIVPESYISRSGTGIETVIKDLNLFILDSRNNIVQRHYVARHNISDNKCNLSLKLLKNVRYEFFVCANIGFEMTAIKSVKDLQEFKYHLAYAGEYDKSIPMSCNFSYNSGSDDSSMEIKLKRMVAKISVSIDRSNLPQNIKVIIKSIAVRQTPKHIYAFKENSGLYKQEVFEQGYFKNIRNSGGLNNFNQEGISKEVFLYVPENIKANYGDGAGLQPDPVSSFVEIRISYIKNKEKSEEILHRFFIGEKLSVERNSHYHFTAILKSFPDYTPDWKMEKVTK